MIPSEDINKAKQGDDLAFKRLFVLLSPRAKILCKRYIRNKEDAEEVLQDGFYNLYKGINNFKEEEGTFYNYYKRIMINECLMYLRRNNTFYTVSEDFIPHTAVIEDVFAGKEPHEIVKLILQLPEGYSTILNLYAIDGYDHKEIAAALAIAESTSRSQLARARRALQEKLADNDKNNRNERSK